MIVPRHKICDLCSKKVGGPNNRYFIIKSKNFIVNGYIGRNINCDTKIHICNDCMAKIARYIQIELGEENNG